MRCVFKIIFWAALSCVCLGSTDPVIEELLERIKALETKDVLKTSRIEQLEQQSTSYHDELQSLREANEVLQHDIAMATVENKDKDSRISKLEKRMEELMVYRSTGQHIIRKLQNKVSALQQKEASLENIIDVIIHNYQDTMKKLNQPSNQGNEGTEVSKNINMNSTGFYQKEEDTGQTPNKMNHRINNTSKGTSDIFPNKRKAETIRTGQLRKQAPSDIVAFHAVVTPLSVDHMGTNQNIKFDGTFLNLGGGYHNQHGVFIAPKSGIYLFSVTIAAPPGKFFRADLFYEGTRLSSVIGQSDESHHQASVTVVTQMNAGDEVWVLHVSPTDGTIWGNKFSSFAGVLLIET